MPKVMSGVNPLPPRTVQIAWASNPLDSSQTWTDITNYVKKLSWNRGKQHELGSFQPGSMQMLCTNIDRRFDPSNSSGPYAPNVDVNKQCQFLVTWNHLSSAAGGATMSAGWTAVTNCAVSYVGGTLRLTSTAGGDMNATTATGTGGFAVTPGKAYSAMASFKTAVSARACKVGIAFYTSAGALIGSINYGSAANDSTVAFTQVTEGFTAPSNAAFAAVVVFVTATGAGAEVHDVQQVGCMPWSGITIWEAGGGVAQFTGFIDSIKPIWKDDLKSDVVINVTDAFRQFSPDLIGANYPAVVMTTDGASDLWPLSDAAGPTAIDKTVAGNGTYSTTGVTYGSAAINATMDPSTVVTFNNYLVGNMTVPSARKITGTGAFSIEFWFKTSGPTDASTQQLFTQVQNPGVSGGRIEIAIGGSPNNVSVLVGIFGSSVNFSSTTTGVWEDNAWHHCVITRAANGKDVILYLDGLNQGSGSDSAAHDVGLSVNSIYVGNISSRQPSGLVDSNTTMANLAFYQGITLTPTQVANHNTIGRNGWLAQDSGARIAAVLATIGWPSALQSLATGDSQVIVPTASLSSTTALSYMQQCELAEHGNLFVNKAGIVTFINRTALLKTPLNAVRSTLGENSNEVNYKPSPEFSLDIVDLYNASAVTRSGGVQQYASDSTSQTKYGVTSLLTESGLLITTDSEALSRAQWNVSHFKTPTMRVRSVKINPRGDPALRFDCVLFRELMDRITVNRRPYSTSNGWGTPTFTQDYYIEGISSTWDFENGTCEYGFALSYAEAQTYWVLGDSVLGVLDSTTRAAY